VGFSARDRNVLCGNKSASWIAPSVRAFQQWRAGCAEARAANTTRIEPGVATWAGGNGWMAGPTSRCCARIADIASAQFIFVQSTSALFYDASAQKP